jgi:alkaline phosphatase D
MPPKMKIPGLLLIITLLGGPLISPSPASAAELTHGPVVGGVTSTSANIFIRTDLAANVALRYGTDPNFATYLTTAPFATNGASDFTRIIPLPGLTPETTYYLNPVVNGVPQFTAPPYPTFKTFPAAGSERDFDFVVLTDFVTVSKLTSAVPTFASAAAENPAFVFIGGDFDHRNPATLDDKRAMFRDLYGPTTLFMDGFASQILWKSPIVHQWDDHDAGVNNVDKTYPDWSISQQVFEEYVPTYPLPAVKPGIWQQFRYAQAEFFVLDCRSQRDPETDSDDANKSMLDGNNLGATGELQWLENGLLASTARWKVIFTSVIINPSTKYPDSWAGYQNEWGALRNFIDSHAIPGVVFISGDLHLSAIDNGANAGFPEMCVTQPNAARGGFCATGPLGNWSEGYYNDSCSGYGLVTIQHDPDRLTLQLADQDGVKHLSYTLTDDTPTPSPTPTPPPPMIVTQPADAVVREGQRAQFSVAVSGNKPIFFQWKKNSVDIEGGTKPTYQTPKTTVADNQSVFTVSVTNSAGSVLSNGATLTVKKRGHGDPQAAAPSAP